MRRSTRNYVGRGVRSGFVLRGGVFCFIVLLTCAASFGDFSFVGISESGEFENPFWTTPKGLVETYNATTAAERKLSFFRITRQEATIPFYFTVAENGLCRLSPRQPQPDTNWLLTDDRNFVVSCEDSVISVHLSFVTNAKNEDKNASTHSFKVYQISDKPTEISTLVGYPTLRRADMQRVRVCLCDTRVNPVAKRLRVLEQSDRNTETSVDSGPDRTAEISEFHQFQNGPMNRKNCKDVDIVMRLEDLSKPKILGLAISHSDGPVADIFRPHTTDFDVRLYSGENVSIAIWTEPNYLLGRINHGAYGTTANEAPTDQSIIIDYKATGTSEESFEEHSLIQFYTLNPQSNETRDYTIHIKSVASADPRIQSIELDSKSRLNPPFHPHQYTYNIWTPISSTFSPYLSIGFQPVVSQATACVLQDSSGKKVQLTFSNAVYSASIDLYSLTNLGNYSFTSLFILTCEVVNTTNITADPKNATSGNGFTSTAPLAVNVKKSPSVRYTFTIIQQSGSTLLQTLSPIGSTFDRPFDPAE